LGVRIEMVVGPPSGGFETKQQKCSSQNSDISVPLLYSVLISVILVIVD